MLLQSVFKIMQAGGVEAENTELFSALMSMSFVATGSTVRDKTSEIPHMVI